MAKPLKLAVRGTGDIPLREVSGLGLRGGELFAVGDHEPVVITAPVEPWPPQWRKIDLGALKLRHGANQLEAVEPVAERTVLLLQEHPALVLHVDLAAPALLGTMVLEVPEGHQLRRSWLGDRSSRGESLLMADRGHLLVIKEKDPAVILEFGPPGDAPVGWRRGVPGVPPAPGDAKLTVLATWWLDDTTSARLPDISDAAIGPDGALYLLSDQGAAIVRLPDRLDPAGGVVEAEAVWRIAGNPENPEGLVILADGTPLVALDTRSSRRNLLRLEPIQSAPGTS